MSIEKYTRNVTGRYHQVNGPDKNFIKNAENLISDLKCRVPADGLIQGKHYALEPLKHDGALCCSITIFDNRATFVDLRTGTVVSVDRQGRRSTSMIGGRR